MATEWLPADWSSSPNGAAIDRAADKVYQVDGHILPFVRPGVEGASRTYLDMVLDVNQEVGKPGEGVRTLFCVPGIMPIPGGVPPPDTDRLRQRVLGGELFDGEEPSKKDGTAPRTKDHFDKPLQLVQRSLSLALIVVMCSHMKAATVTIDREATTFLNELTTNVVLKFKAIFALLLNLAGVQTAVKEHNWDAFERFKLSTITANQWRGQQDDPDKKRYVFSPLTGKYVLQSKDLPPGKASALSEQNKRAESIGGRLVALRARQISMFPMVGYLILRFLAASIMESLHFFGLAFVRHGDPGVAFAAIMAFVTGIKIFDVSNHDQNAHPELVDIATGYLTKHVINPDWAPLLERSFHPPQMARPDNLKGKGATYGHPTKRGPQTKPGNPSGNPLTSIMAKYLGMFYTIDFLHELVDHVRFEALRNEMGGRIAWPMAAIERLRRSLVSQGIDYNDHESFCAYWCSLPERIKQQCVEAAQRNEIPRIAALLAFCNAGDNTLWMIFDGQCAPEESMMNIVELFITLGTLALWGEAESFEGFKPVDIGRRTARWVPRIDSLMERLLVPERNPKDEESFARGLDYRLIHYGPSPDFGRVYTAIRDASIRRLKFDVFAWAKSKLPPGHAKMVEKYNAADLLALMDKDVIHYKVRLSDLSPEVADMLFVSLAPWQVAAFWNAILPQLEIDPPSPADLAKPMGVVEVLRPYMKGVR